MNWALLAGSLAGVLGLAAIAWALRLGGGGIDSGEEAMRIAEEMLTGFEAREAFLADDGAAALVIGGDGDAAILKRHGAQVAVRRLALPLQTRAVGSGIAIDSGERLFGSVIVSISEDKLLTLV